MQLTVVSDDGDVVRLQAGGKIAQVDLPAGGDPMRDRLGSLGYARKALLDLADVSLIDSSGISWLLVRHKRFREAGGVLVMHSVPPMVLDVIKVLRLDMVFDLAADEPTAAAMAVERKA